MPKKLQKNTQKICKKKEKNMQKMFNKNSEIMQQICKDMQNYKEYMQ